MQASQRDDSSTPSSLILTGEDLQIEELVSVARKGTLVDIADSAFARVQHSHEFLISLNAESRPIYGFNQEVGPRVRSPRLFEGNLLEPDARSLSERYNTRVLLAHGASIGPNSPQDVIRAAMLARVNGLLLGRTGCQPYIVRLMVKFLNEGITPIVPSMGSVGEADINILSYIGLAMMGIGQVLLREESLSAKEALERLGIEPLHPIGKDALSIISSNAYSAGWAALVAQDIQTALTTADLILAFSLEALNGNVAPILKSVIGEQADHELQDTGRRIRYYLEGSYLWKVDEHRLLQDPLSFRTAFCVHSVARNYANLFRRHLVRHLNSSDDNPGVLLGAKPGTIHEFTSQESTYYFSSGQTDGMIIPTANFESFPYVLGLESLCVALGHIASLSCQRILRLSSTEFTGLPAFLAPDETSIAFIALQKTCSALFAEVRQLCMPTSLDYLILANDSEDHATNSVHVLRRASDLVSALYYLLAIELLHAAQAIDLRKRIPEGRDVVLGRATNAMYTRFRERVTFMTSDRALTQDVNEGYKFLKSNTISDLLTMPG